MKDPAARQAAARFKPHVDAWLETLLSDATPEQRLAACLFYQAMLDVAIKGDKASVPKDAVTRLKKWMSGIKRRGDQVERDFFTARAVEASDGRRSRSTAETSAYEEAAALRGVAPVTAERALTRSRKRGVLPTRRRQK